MSAAQWWLLAVTAVAGLVLSWWLEVRRRTLGERVERAEIRSLWKLAKRAPAGVVLRDPGTGMFLGVHRYYGFLEVITGDVNFGDQGTDVRSDAVVTQFAVGGVWRPMSPPIMGQHRPVNDTAPRRTWRQARRNEQFNEETGAMNASVEDLVALRTQLGRALHAAGAGQS